MPPSLHAHGDAGVAAAEFFQDSGQAQGGDAVIASDGERAADHAADLGTDLFRVLAGADNFAEERQHDFAVLGQAYPFFAANEEGKADLGFQRADHSCNSGLRISQKFSGSCQASLLGAASAASHFIISIVFPPGAMGTFETITILL